MEMQKSLVDRVITQIELDIQSLDLMALEEFLKLVPQHLLEAYLPEVDMAEVESEYDGQPDEAQEWHDFDPDC
jgi:hypothetical protein